MAEQPGFRWSLAEDDANALFGISGLADRHVGIGEYRGMEFLHVYARTIINAVPKTSHMPFRHTINAYRGCSHACVYCFARPTHAYLNLDIANDFESKIVVKVNAVEQLHAELRSSRWHHEHIAMGTNTDPYQRAEGKYHLTRGIIGELLAARNPFSILTKSTLILRDVDLIAEAARACDAYVNVSIGTLDRAIAKLTEPGTPPPDKRLDVVRAFRERGVRCGVLIAPILPGLSDSDEQITAVARACVEAGATSIAPVALHLRPGVREHFLEWLSQARPDLMATYRDRFSKGAYQRREHQRRIDSLVASVVGDDVQVSATRVIGDDETATPPQTVLRGEQLQLV